MTNDLRKQAEAKLALSPEPLAAASPAETQRLLHELRVHQIELEMQNDELRKAQTEIEAGRVRYFDLYDLAPVGYVTVGEKGLVQEANLTAASLLGVNRAALVRQPLTRFIFEEDQDVYYLHHKRLLATGEPQECELRLIKPDGALLWAHLAATAAQAEDGAPLCRVVMSSINERKQREAVLTFLVQTGGNSTDRPFFQSLAEYLAQSLEMDFVCIDRLEGDGLNARTVAVYCDGHFEDNVTYALKDTPCGDVVGKTVCCFPASVCQFFPRDQVLQELRAESYIGVTLFGLAGQPIGLIAVISRRPLASRSQAEAILQTVGLRAASELQRLDVETALRASEDRLRSLFDQAPLGYQSLDEDGRFIEVNHTWLETLGYRREEVIGKWFGDFLAPEFSDAFRKRFPLFKANGKIHSEFKMLHKNGESRFIAFEGRIGHWPDGTFKQTHCILSDITASKDAEAQKAVAFEALQQEKDALKRWQSLTVGRELAMVELKKEVNALLKQAGQPDKYKIVEGRTE